MLMTPRFVESNCRPLLTTRSWVSQSWRFRSRRQRVPSRAVSGWVAFRRGAKLSKRLDLMFLASTTRWVLARVRRKNCTLQTVVRRKPVTGLPVRLVVGRIVMVPVRRVRLPVKAAVQTGWALVMIGMRPHSVLVTVFRERPPRFSFKLTRS